MTTQTENQLAAVTVYRQPDLRQTIQSLPTPVCDSLKERALASIHAAKSLVAESRKQQVHQAFRSAEFTIEELRTREETLTAAVQRAEDAASSAPSGSIAAGTLALLLCAVCVGAEYVFNLRILTWLTGVSSHSPLGVMLGLAPSVAPLVLDRMIALLFHVEDPWGSVRSRIAEQFGASARRLATVTLLLTVAALNVYFLWPLAETRAIATDLMTTTSTSLSDLDKQTMEWALFLVTLCITVNGALFYLYGTHELRLWRSRRRLKAEAARLRSERHKVRSDLTRGRSSLAECLRQWEDAETLAAKAAAEFEANLLLDLQLVMDKQVRPGSYYERVIEILDRSPRSMLAHRSANAFAAQSGIA